jgi:3-oxoacyl-[acyl-carrier-protein] synthase-3
MQKEVFITRVSRFLPNNPISNEEMETYIGLIHENSSKSKSIVLRNNGIKCRYYALDKNGKATHTNAQMAALAVERLFEKNAAELKEVDLLCCGSSTPDQWMPSHAVMVHGWLKESGDMEVVSPSGNCCSGMHALKYAWMAVKAGLSKKAVVAGSERASRIMNHQSFEEEAKKLAQAEGNPYISFDKEFLRWMLSDGAAAALLQDHVAPNELALRIDAIEGVSYAHLTEPCMYAAADKLADGTFVSYMDMLPAEIMQNSVLSIKQDVKLLSKYIVDLGTSKLIAMLKEHQLAPEDITWFLPHISSEFFRNKMDEGFRSKGLMIPMEKWFTNLSQVGNVGAGSIYLMIEELLREKRIKKGDKIVLAVPESARFSYVFAILTAV